MNLYIDKETLDFAKRWSYVTDVPISRMLEEYLQQQQERLNGVSPFQWLNDHANSQTAPAGESSRTDLEAYLYNAEEEEFCKENPDHPRAKVRRKLLQEYEQSWNSEMEERKRKEREFITRWLKVFPVK